jgi:hypothetical protein
MFRESWRRKFLRFFGSLAGSGFTYLGLVIAAFGLIPKEPSQWIFWSMAFLAGIGFCFWLFQAWFEYRRKTNDPTWALKYQEMWDKAEGRVRPNAADALRKFEGKLSEIDLYENELSNIDDVLDILEDIGFYMEGDHISPEVACHHFDHWIRGYWYNAHTYIEAWRKREPARWRHIKPLLQATAEVNHRSEKLIPTNSELKLFLEQEAAGAAASKPS